MRDSANTAHVGADSITRQQFLDRFKALQARFNHNKLSVRASESAFEEALKRFRDFARNDPLKDSRLSLNHPLRAPIQGLVNEVQAVVAQWEQGVSKQKANTEFRERTGDSLLVFVYGKVKAGKSSLGNYVAWGRHDPGVEFTGTAQDAGGPEYFMAFSTGATETVSEAEIRRRRKFKVADTETTSAIQGFKLPGLTWVDSPGLHSKEEANGQLAQQYVDAADLVLYLTASGAPGKRSDQVELQALGRKEHNLAVLITGSDRFDEDEDEEGNIIKFLRMKTQQDREAQICHVREALDERQLATAATEDEQAMVRTLRRAKVFSVSVTYAEMHPDDQGMRDSGVGAMLHQVACLAESDGVRDKLVRPLRTLKTFLHQIRDGDVKRLLTSLSALTAKLATEKAEARRLAESEVQSIRSGIGRRIDELSALYAMNDAAFRKAVQGALAQWEREGVEKISQAYAKAVEDLLPCATNDLKLALPEFERKTVTVPRKRSIRAKQGAAIGTLAAGLAATLLTGGLAAIAIGVAGTVAGGYAGSKLGSMLDEDELLTLDAGDNSHEVALKSGKLVQELFARRMRNVIADVESACFTTLSAWIDRLRQEAHNVDVRTQELLRDIEHEIASQAPAA